MLETPTQHFLDQGFVSIPKGSQLAYPSEGFGVMSITLPALGQNRPNSMQLPMLAKQMLTTKAGGGNVPNSQLALLMQTGGGTRSGRHYEQVQQARGQATVLFLQALMLLRVNVGMLWPTAVPLSFAYRHHHT
jgi:hypothetical protein